MANKKRYWGMLALALTFGLVLTGCPAAEDDNSGKGPANDNAKLVGKWKAQSDTSDPPTVVFEFLNSGMVNWSGSLVAYTYQGTTLKISGVTGTAALSDGGNTLYISGIGGGADGTFSKIGGNPDTENGNKIKITGVPDMDWFDGHLWLYDNNGYEVADGQLSSYTSGDLTLELFDLQSHRITPWKGSGSYAIVISMYFNHGGSEFSRYYCYLNGASPSSVNGFGSLPKLAFTSGLTTVAFSKFAEVTWEQLFGKH